MIRGRPGPRRPLPSYFLAISCRCQRRRVSGATSVSRSREGLSTEGLGLCGEASTLGVGEPEPARAELFPQDAILLLEIVDHITLLLIDPARDRHDEELEGLGKRRHVGERNRRPSRTSQPGEGPA